MGSLQFCRRALELRHIGNDAANPVHVAGGVEERELADNARVKTVSLQSGFLKFHRHPGFEHLEVVGAKSRRLFSPKKVEIGLAQDLRPRRAAQVVKYGIGIKIAS